MMNLNKIGWCDFLCNPVTITCQYARTSPEWCPNDKELFMFTKEEVIAILTSMKKDRSMCRLPGRDGYQGMRSSFD